MGRKSELEALDAALVEIAGSYAPITVRGAFYQAVSRGLVPKYETKGYRLVQRRLLKLRESGEIPIDWMTDGSRTVYGHVRYRNADEFAQTVKTRYRQDYWAEAEEYVEIWIEKEALAGVVRPVVVDEFGLELFVTRGFASLTYLQEAADDISLEERPVYVRLFTDFDPAGMNIADRVEEDLERRSGYDDIHVERVAVTPEQIQLYDLPTRPTKRPQRRRLTRYEAAHGAVSVELDAMPPDVLRDIVRERIERHMDPWRLEQMRMIEREEREGLAMPERSEGARLLADAEAGTLDAVLVYRLDRIGRSLLVVVDAHDRLGQAGVALKSANEPIDTPNPSGRLIFQMLASFAEFERATITERSRDGLHRAFKNGKHIGRIPYGYDIGDDDRFVIVEEEARIVRRIIANIAGGSTLYKEAKRLNDESEPSPGTKYRGIARKHGVNWCHSTIRNIVFQRAYAGTHVVNSSRGTVERSVPAIVDPDHHRRAVARMAENKRYGGGKESRNYLLRGLVLCAHCGTAYVGDCSVSSMGYRYHYYACRKKKATSDARVERLTCPRAKAGWLEDLVWADLRGFLEDPGEVLQRVQEQLTEDRAGNDLEERRTSLTRRLTAKQEEKSKYVKLYAQGHLDEEELEVHMADLKNQVDNLKLLISSVESDLVARNESRMVARTTEAYLVALRKNLDEVEQATEEAFESRRQLATLLVEKIVVGRNEEGQTKVDVTYRFGPPEVTVGEDSAYGVQNSEEFAKAHARGCTQGLLRGHPKMSSYEVAVQRTGSGGD